MANKQVAIQDKMHSRRMWFAGLVILVFAVAGSYMLVGSHAATPGYTQILNYQSRAQTDGVTDVPASVYAIGTQTVSQVNPGAQLVYVIGGKWPITQECYYASVLPSNGGGTTATVVFAGQGASTTRKLTYDPTRPNDYQKVCVNTGTGGVVPYNVFNKSPSTGPAVLVYEDVVVE